MYGFENDNEDDLYQRELDEELQKFNWGCFLLPLFWVIGNLAPAAIPIFAIMLIIAFLIIIKFLGLIFIIPGFIVLIALWIYTGKKGNEWAWEGKINWKSVEDFRKVQRIWGIAGIFSIFIWPILAVSLVGIIGTNFQKEFASSSLELMQAKIYTKIIISGYKNDSGSVIVDKVISADSHSFDRFNENSFVTRKDPDTIYTINNEQSCDLEKNNCYILVSKKEGNEIKPKAAVFYDSQGKMKEAQY